MAWHRHTFTSEALRGNALGDPYERPLHVWSPDGVTDRLPSVYVIQGMTGMADAWFNVEPWSPSTPTGSRRSTRRPWSSSSTRSRRSAARSIVDSPGIGNYHTYLCDEIVPFVDANYPTRPRRRTAASRASRPAGTER